MVRFSRIEPKMAIFEKKTIPAKSSKLQRVFDKKTTLIPYATYGMQDTFTKIYVKKCKNFIAFS